MENAGVVGQQSGVANSKLSAFFSSLINASGSWGMREHLVQLALLPRWLSVLFVRLQQIKAKSFCSTWKRKLLGQRTRRTGKTFEGGKKTSAGFRLHSCQSRGCQLITSITGLRLGPRCRTMPSVPFRMITSCLWWKLEIFVIFSI